MEQKHTHRVVLCGYEARGAEPCLNLGTAGSCGLERLQVVRGIGWEDLIVRVIYHPCKVNMLLPEDGMLDVPWEATAKPLERGQGRIVFQGIKDGAVCNTMDLLYRVARHGKTEGVDPMERTPGTMEDVMRKADALRTETTRSAAAAAESAAEAKTGAAQAAQSAQAAADGAAQASASAGAAAGSESAAAASAAAAEESARSAGEQVSAAAGSAAAAAESAAEAKTGAAQAAQSAQAAADGAAQAKTGAAQAAQSAQAAADGAEQAKTSAGAAAGSESAAAASAAAAEESARSAGEQVSAAAGSAAAAAESAAEAKTGAAQAAQSAQAAADGAAQAKTSAGAAAGSESAAASSAAAAEESARSAGEQVSAAAGSAAAAAESAAEAKTGAEQAAESAQAAADGAAQAKTSAGAAAASAAAAEESAREAAKALEGIDPNSGVVSVNGKSGIVVLGAGDVGAAAASHTHTAAQVGASPTGHTHTKSEITDMPASLPSPGALKLQGNGTELASYDGSSAKTVNITPGNIGAAAASHSHTAAQVGASPTGHTHTKSEITDMPASLPNPGALKLQGNGTELASYDGSSAKTVNITPGSIGAAAASHSHTAAQVGASPTGHTHTKSEITDMPASLPSPGALKLQGNGTELASYDGSSAKTVNITPGNIGAAAASHSHTAAEVGAAAASHGHTAAQVGAAAASHTHTAGDISGLPASLPNPNALTLQIGSNDTVVYDGSAEKTLPVAGRVQFAYNDSGSAVYSVFARMQAGSPCTMNFLVADTKAIMSSATSTMLVGCTQYTDGTLHMTAHLLDFTSTPYAEFGYYLQDGVFYIGVRRGAYCSATSAVLLSDWGPDCTDFGDFGTVSSEPSGWTAIETQTQTAGTDGQSAYDAAQAGGYTDTEANFYADLAAMQGLAAELAAI